MFDSILMKPIRIQCEINGLGATVDVKHPNCAKRPSTAGEPEIHLGQLRKRGTTLAVMLNIDGDLDVSWRADANVITIFLFPTTTSNMHFVKPHSGSFGRQRLVRFFRRMSRCWVQVKCSFGSSWPKYCLAPRSPGVRFFPTFCSRLHVCLAESQCGRLSLAGTPLFYMPQRPKASQFLFGTQPALARL